MQKWVWELMCFIILHDVLRIVQLALTPNC